MTLGLFDGKQDSKALSVCHEMLGQYNASVNRNPFMLLHLPKYLEANVTRNLRETI
jgi:hypothetical protein